MFIAQIKASIHHSLPRVGSGCFYSGFFFSFFFTIRLKETEKS